MRIINTDINNFKIMIDKNAYYIDGSYKKILNNYLSSKATNFDLSSALLIISNCLMQHYHQKVVILINECNVPLQVACQHGYYDEMVDWIFKSNLKPFLVLYYKLNANIQHV